MCLEVEQKELSNPSWERSVNIASLDIVDGISSKYGRAAKFNLNGGSRLQSKYD